MSSVKGNFVAVYYPIDPTTGTESATKMRFSKASPSDGNENYDRLYEVQANMYWKNPSSAKEWPTMLRS